MAVTGVAQGVGLISSMVSSFLGGRVQKKQIEQQNANDLATWGAAVTDLREQLTVAYNRTEIALSEVNRDKIVNQMAVRAVGAKERGTREVRAAQLGITGRRATKDVTKEVSRMEAEAISEIEINTQIEFTNVVNQFNDAARSAIANLNAHRPNLSAVPSSGMILGAALGTGIDYYSDLSSAQKSDLKANFKFSDDTLVSGPQVIGIGGK